MSPINGKIRQEVLKAEVKDVEQQRIKSGKGASKLIHKLIKLRVDTLKLGHKAGID
jgi:hypothetical protein